MSTGTLFVPFTPVLRIVQTCVCAQGRQAAFEADTASPLYWQANAAPNKSAYILKTGARISMQKHKKQGNLDPLKQLNSYAHRKMLYQAPTAY